MKSKFDEIKEDIKRLTYINLYSVPAGLIYQEIHRKQQEILLILAKLVNALENDESKEDFKDCVICGPIRNRDWVRHINEHPGHGRVE